MNFLAHLYLSFGDHDLMIGNFIADHTRPATSGHLPDGVQLGIRLHRAIDGFTDSHPAVREGIARLRPRHGKYAPVVIDILYDHLLAANWPAYSAVPLQEFADTAYRLLENRKENLPEGLQQRLPYMIGDNFLYRYSTEEGLRFAFRMMERRARFPSGFSRSVDDLYADFDLFDAEFNAFFPDVVGFSQAWLEEYRG